MGMNKDGGFSTSDGYNERGIREERTRNAVQESHDGSTAQKEKNDAGQGEEKRHESGAGSDIVIFGGTTEGRKLSEMLAGTSVQTDVYVATAYGASLLPHADNICIHTGRLNREELQNELSFKKPELVVDATHPYAAVITENLEELCGTLDLSYMRIEREKSDTHLSHALTVSSMEEAADFLDGTEGNILVTTGSKELAAIRGIRGYRERCYARVLPRMASLEKCEEISLPPSHIIAMQGPFSERMNRDLMADLEIGWLLTKDSGEEGGCPEKIAAAEKEGAGVVLIGRPEESDEAIPLEKAVRIIREEWEIPERKNGGTFSNGISLTDRGNFTDEGIPADDRNDADGRNGAGSGNAAESANSADARQFSSWNGHGKNVPENFAEQVDEAVRKRFEKGRNRGLEFREKEEGVPEKWAALIGIGPGRMGLVTEEAIRYICSTDLLIGAGRMLEAGENIREEYGPEGFRKAETVRAIRPADIVEELENRSYKRAAVLYSGDITRYSGAKGLRKELDRATGSGRLKNVRILTYNGISSVSYFLGKTGTAAEDVFVTSLHGREGSLVPLVRTHAKVLSLLGTGEETSLLAEKLLDYGLMDVRLTVGEHLSYEDEKITSGYPANFKGIRTEKLALLLVENPHPVEEKTGFGIPDEEFLRAKVPMTKKEVRTAALSSMNIRSDSVVWDVGAGTGSVSVEAALHAPEGMVYAVEQKKEAADLISENKRKFICDNLQVIEGKAPDALYGLPAPDSVFIGGSGGNLQEIVNCIFDKNIDARIVITAVTTETNAELSELRNHLPAGKQLEQTELIAVREREAGRYHLRSAESPVTIAVVRDC